jgi:metal-sulfur cluster biosynthetic enzyme
MGVTMNAHDVRNALRDVLDPELGVNIVDLGLVYDIAVDANCVRITMTMTSPACPLREYIKTLVQSAILDRVPDVESVTVDVVDDPPWSEDRMTDEGRRQLS